MADNKWIILPVEVKHREFLSRIILSAKAIGLGYNVLLGKDTSVRRMAPSLPKGVIFDKSLGTVRHGKPQRFKKLGHKVVVFDEESTGYYGSPEQFLSVRLAEETLTACERWYCISSKLQNHLSKNYPAHKDKFLTSGMPRTDTWQTEFLDFYEEERQHIAETHGPFILFNSNFGGIIHARGDAFVAKQIRGQRSAYSEVEKRMANIFEQGKPNLKAFLKLLPKILDWFPQHRVVIRPHPSETLSFWQNHFGNNNRVIVSNEGVATPWILASDMLVHHGCTTGIEAAILGKPQVMYAPFPDEHHETDVMRAFTEIFKQEDKLKSYMQLQVNEPNKKPISLSKGETYFANLTGKLVTDKILEDIEKHHFLSGDLPKSLSPLVRLRMWLAENKTRSERELNYSKQKWPGTSVEEIRKYLMIADKALGLNNSYEIDEPFPELFHIRKTA